MESTSEPNARPGICGRCRQLHLWRHSGCGPSVESARKIEPCAGCPRYRRRAETTRACRAPGRAVVGRADVVATTLWRRVGAIECLFRIACGGQSQPKIATV